MNKSIGCLVAAVLVGAGIYLIEQRQIKRLQVKNQALAVHQPISITQPEPVAALNRAEKDELERLRKNKTELLRLRNEVTQLRRERDAYKQRLAPERASGVGLTRTPAPRGFISREQLANVANNSTPEAALQTYMGAVTSGDFERALAAVLPSAANELLGSRASYKEEIQEAARGFKGVQMTAKKILSDDRVDIQMLTFEEGQEPDVSIFHMVKVGNEWRFSGPAKDSNWNRDGQIQSLLPSQ